MHLLSLSATSANHPSIVLWQAEQFEAEVQGEGPGGGGWGRELAGGMGWDRMRRQVDGWKGGGVVMGGEAHPVLSRFGGEGSRSDDDDELMLNVLRCQLTY